MHAVVVEHALDFAAVDQVVETGSCFARGHVEQRNVVLANGATKQRFKQLDRAARLLVKPGK